MFAIFDIEDAARLTYFAIHSLQHRGQQGAGIVASDGTKIKGYRNVGLLSDVFKEKSILKGLKGRSALGALWYSSKDASNTHNIEPLLYKFYDGHVAIAMNGNLTNASWLRNELEEDGAVFHSSSHAEVIMHLIRRSKKETFEERIKDALRKLDGAFSIMILSQDALYGAVDRHARRPLVLGKLNESYCIGSESCALNVIGADFIEDISAGEFVKISVDGVKKDSFISPSNILVEAMEYIYFARPDSTILGRNVHLVRKKSGKILAREYPAKADIVVGVPNSSLSLATGYAEEIGLPYEMGLIKNQYIARTFIEPSQDLRDLGVKMKLSALRDVVAGKDLVLLDDSIVRGTTSKKIITMLKKAGAKKIHLRIGSPMIVFPSYSGIDMKTSKELVAANMTKDEIRDMVGADSLEFLSKEGLIESVGFDIDSKNGGLSLDIFDGDYEDGLGNYRKDFIDNLTSIQKNYLESKEIR